MKTMVITGAYFARSSAVVEIYTVKEEHREEVSFNNGTGKWSCSCQQKECRHILVARAIAMADGRGKKIKK